MSPVLTQYVSQPITLDEQTQKMKQHLLQDIRRSAYVYRVDCGGCNACEIEIFAAITPVFDAERFGIKVVSSPRHADILLFTGAVTRAMRMPALRAYESAPIINLCFLRRVRCRRRYFPRSLQRLGRQRHHCPH